MREEKFCQVYHDIKCHYEKEKVLNSADGLFLSSKMLLGMRYHRLLMSSPCH